MGTLCWILAPKLWQKGRMGLLNKKVFTGLAAVGASVLSAWLAFPVQAQGTSFSQWLEGVRQEALGRGLDPAVIEAALSGVEPIPRIIELDRRQPEFTLTFWKYLEGRVTPGRIQRGRELLVQHRALLEKVQRKYGVQPRFLVAIWGLESNFGDHTGVFPLIGAVATLAHDPRRDKFFRAQLLAALGIMAAKDIPTDVKSSWAGAMGAFQFIPTTYRDFAVDFDGDGRRDLWGSLPDGFASAANYLSRSGWRGNRTWGREVRLPPDFDLNLADMDMQKPLGEWQRLGVRRIDGRDLPRVDIKGSVILPAGFHGPAFMVYQNYRTVLVWNRSLLYAVAVGHLADRLQGKGPLATARRTEIPLSRADVADLQKRLIERGFDPGGADGVVGPNTRRAIKAFQRSANLPPDGYPSAGLIERLRGTGKPDTKDR